MLLMLALMLMLTLYWCAGVLEAGTLASWQAGAPTCWQTGTLACGVEVREQRYAGCWAVVGSGAGLVAWGQRT
jgi:hypothetical protein